MTLRQRQPREEDPAYLAYVRTLPCLICRRPGPSDPAHLRSAARQYGKPHTGMGEKPSDCWVLPLCRTHHEDQHRNNELSWWTRQGLPDPFGIAVALYASRPVLTRPRRQPRAMSKKARKAKPSRPIRSNPSIPQRENPWPSGRKIASRNTLTKAQP